MNDSSTHSSSTDPLIGHQLDGRYLIVSLLGSGASGRVYKAKHILLDGFVAIKLLSAGLVAGESELQRFQREASVLSSLLHPNIVKFLSFGHINEFGHYMVLEFIEGETLADRIDRSGVLNLEQALNVFLDICSALEYAHSREVLHRDLKPANIMLVNEAGATAKLVDFGIFKDMGANSQNLTKTGAMLGSTNYMSPEQCRSERLDLRSDIYSMGCVMYETLVGRPPMEDENELLVMQNHLHKQIKNVPAKNGISKEFEQLILRCLEKNKEQRFASASELKVALKDALQAPIQKRSRTLNILNWSAIVVTVLLVLAATNASLSSLKNKRDTSKVVVGSTRSLRRRNRVPEATTSVQGCNDLRIFILDNIDDPKFDARTIGSAYTSLCWKSDLLGLPSPTALGEKLVVRLKNEVQNKKGLTAEQQRDYYEYIADLQGRLGQHGDAISTRIKLLQRWPNEDEDYYQNRVCGLFGQLASEYDELGDKANTAKYLRLSLKHSLERDDVNGIINAYLKLAEHSHSREEKREFISKAYAFEMKRLAEKEDLEPKQAVHLSQEMNVLGECQNVTKLVRAFGQKLDLSVQKNHFLSDVNAIGTSVPDSSLEYIDSAELLHQEALAYIQLHRASEAEHILRKILKFFDLNNIPTQQYADFSRDLLFIVNDEKRYDEILPLANDLLRKMRDAPADVYVHTLIDLLGLSAEFRATEREKLGLENTVRDANEKYAKVCPKPCAQMMKCLAELELFTKNSGAN